MTEPASDFNEELSDLLLNRREDPERRMARLKRAVDLADSRGDLRAGLMARLTYVRATEFAGRHQESLVAFAWCLGVCDQHPDLLEQFSGDILWKFKWIAGSIARFPAITRGQIEETMQQMTRYYQRAGMSLRAVHGLRASNAVDLGDIDQIAGHRKAWLKSPKDGSEDCRACETGNTLSQYLALGELKKAVRAADGLLKGRLSCSVQPQSAQSMMLMPLFRLGMWDLADQAERASARQIKGDANYLDDMGDHTAFLTVTDQLTRAVAMLEAGLKQVVHVSRPFDQAEFYKGGRLLLLRLSDIGRRRIKLRIPAALDFYRKDNSYPVAELLQVFDRRGGGIAADFDRRNGNDYRSRCFREWDDLLKEIHPLKRKEVPEPGSPGPR
jgi:hypothetical protein